ncbi:MAG: hypothetical protein K0S30_763 [Clostridia bacterium]|nr:hypothetical protein [Clostridia bacterium]
MYKVQRGIILLLLLMMSFVFQSCRGDIPSDSLQSKLHNKLVRLKTYEVDAMITFLKDTDENKLEMKQMVEIGGKYKLTLNAPEHLKGYITYFDGKDLSQYSPITKRSVLCKGNEVRNQLLLSSFIHNYLNTDNIKADGHTLDDRSCMTFEVPIPGDYKYMASEKVWFDEDELNPIKMEIYDLEGKVMIQLDFSHFKYNTEMKF